jgi:hypothetical protein
MSNNEYVAPVDHGVLSSTGSVAVGTAGGILKSVGKMALWTVGICSLIGAAIGVSLATGGAGFLAGPIAAGFGGALLGVIPGALAAVFLSGPTAMVGAGKGASNAYERVSMEKGMAHSMQMQVQAARAMNDNRKYDFPQQGSPMNQASSNVQASSIESLGQMAGQNLARG